jgi:hypothetical protein
MGFPDILRDVGLFRFGFAYERKRVGRTRADTQPAADAPIQIQDRFLIVYREGFHPTALDAGPTTFTWFGIEAGHKRAGNETGRIRVAFNTAEHAAATATTGSDKRGSLSV